MSEPRPDWWRSRGNRPLLLRWAPSGIAAGPALGVLAFIVLYGAACLSSYLQFDSLVPPTIDDLAAYAFLDRRPETAPVSILRDWPSTIQIAMIAALLPLTIRLLRGCDEMIPRLLRSGTLVVAATDFSEFRRDVTKVGAAFCGWFRNTVQVALGVGVSLVAAWGYGRAGVLGVLAPKDGTPRSVYDEWWGRLWVPTSPVWIAIASIGTYLILVFSVVVWRLGLLSWRWRHRVTLSFDPDDLDGGFGWAPIRAVTVTCYWCLGWSAIGVTGFARLVDGGSVAFVAPFLITFVAGALLLNIPARIYAQSARRYQESARQELRALLREVNRPASPWRRDRRQLLSLSIAVRSAQLRAIPASLISPGRLAAQLAFVVSPALLAFVQMLQMAAAG